MFKALVALTVVFVIAMLAIACGGSDDGGLLKGASKQAQAGGTTAAQPDVPRQSVQGGPPPSLPNLPIAVPSIQIPEVKTGSTTGACALLTKQDAADVLKAPVNDGKSLDLPKQNLGVMTVEVASCSYNASQGTGEVSLQTWKGGDKSQVSLMAGFICQQKEKVTGLGDTACWYSNEHREIQVIKGASFIDLTVRGAPGNADDAVKALAKKVIDRVP